MVLRVVGSIPTMLFKVSFIVGSSNGRITDFHSQNINYMAYIYLITNLINNKKYVGKTTNTIKERW